MNLKILTKHIEAGIKKHWILIAIIVVGIFLRTYNFEDWLRFGPDQVRDATLIGDAISGERSIKMGPQMGNTRFNLGPLYYYAQYFSASIFGDSPQAMAYPDLFFSILAIPVLFLFLHKYFSKNISLFLTAIMAVSYFSISVARFASNQNSIPFFVLVFLCALLAIMEKNKSKEMFFWYVAVGIALGVGIQLHVILLFSMPVIVGVVFVWLFWKKMFSWKGLAFMVLAILIMNVGQIISEIRSGGSNTRALYKTTIKQQGPSSDHGKFLRNSKTVAICQVVSNVHFVSSLIDEKKCGEAFELKELANPLYTAKMKFIINLPKILAIFLSLIFCLVGYFLLLKSALKEKELSKKNFLSLLIIYNAVTLFVLFPVAAEIELRYFIVLNFMPFVLVGLWLKMLENIKYKKIAKVFIGFFVIILFATNIYVCKNAMIFYINEQASSKEKSVMGEAKLISDYMLKNNNGRHDVYLSGSRLYLKRFYAPLQYLTDLNDLNIIRVSNMDNVSPNEKVFYITSNTDKKIEATGSYRILEKYESGNLIVYTIQ